MKKPQSIGSILEKTLKSLEIDIPVKSYSIWGAWKEIVGESIALHTQPRSIRNRILFINVSHPTWMQQLQFFKPNILEKINHFLKEPLIQDIRFRLGKISQPLPIPSQMNTWQEEDLDQKTLKRVDDLLKKIDDQEVKMKLRNILVNGAKLEQFKKKSKKGVTS
jgi:predicted nucleic acid-binding Zn ribbon protein